jgi:hypothetical protein
MPKQPATLVTQEMLDQRDVWSDPLVSRPISQNEIIKWAIAVYWPEKPPPLYWDEKYAESTHFKGVIAPQDFNPFAWPVDRPPPPKRLERAGVAGVGQRVMNGGQTDTFGVPMRPGDVTSESRALVNWEEREGRLGLTIFSYTEIRWTNQHDELVKSRTSVGIRY